MLLKLRCNGLLANFTFNVNLRRYDKASAEAVGAYREALELFKTNNKCRLKAGPCRLTPLDPRLTPG